MCNHRVIRPALLLCLCMQSRKATGSAEDDEGVQCTDSNNRTTTSACSLSGDSDDTMHYSAIDVDAMSTPGGACHFQADLTLCCPLGAREGGGAKN